MKLSIAQKRALEKLSETTWKSAYELQESMATLNALYNKGLVKRRNEGVVGSFWTPSTTIEYRKI